MSTTPEPTNLVAMDKNVLVNLIIEKEKRIQDLERIVEDQKRLRLQDSNQVEEKAAKIKLWVTNKLKELENQNKQLKDQNKKQKEVVESLRIKLASLSPISSPRKVVGSSLDQVQFIDHQPSSMPQSPVQTIDVNKSLKTRKPQLKSNLSSSHVLTQASDQSNLRITLNSCSSSIVTPTPTQRSFSVDHQSSADHAAAAGSPCGGVSYVSIGASSATSKPQLQARFDKTTMRQDSPLYDCVTLELVNSENVSATKDSHNNNNISTTKQHNLNQTWCEPNTRTVAAVEPVPPPLPLHQSGRLRKHSGGNLAAPDAKSHSSSSQSEELDFNTIRGNNRILSKCESFLSSSPLHTGLNSNGIPFAEHNQENLSINSKAEFQSGLETQSNYKRMTSHTLSSHSSTNSESANMNQQVFKTDRAKLASVAQSPFDSPLRSRTTGKDTMIRSQSVRKNSVPESLYDFVAADLVKRGYLLKQHGALRGRSNRWFVLKNFHLYSYKSEEEETTKTAPNMTLKLDSSVSIQLTNQQSNDCHSFKILTQDKSLLLIADSAKSRDDWNKILTIAINLSDIQPNTLLKHNSSHEGILTMTRHGHTKRCLAVLVNHILFFLKSPMDPSPLSYLSVKNSKIREIIDTNDHDIELEEEQDRDGAGGGVAANKRQSRSHQECSLAIYPKFSTNTDPVYLTLGSQQDVDEWLYFLSSASGLDQSSGTEFERTLTQLMITSLSTTSRRALPIQQHPTNFSEHDSTGGLVCCLWREHPIMSHTDRHIPEPLTDLPNETLKMEAVELFKSITMITQIPVEPVAIDYHVSLLQNCFERFLKYSELRNEFFAQLIKQSTYVLHKSFTSKLSSSGSSGCSSINQRSSNGSMSPSSSECRFLTNPELIESLVSQDRSLKYDTFRSTSARDRNESSPTDEDLVPPPTQSELLQVMQVLAIAVSLKLPRGRMRCWLIDHLRKFSSTETNLGKYAIFTLKAIDRTLANGPRDHVPARTEIVSILLKNPHDFATPHSLPVNFDDGSYLVIGADGSTTVKEFLNSICSELNTQEAVESELDLFADDPYETDDLHILERERKILDVVGWWEQTFRQHNSGRFSNTRSIKLICKKQLYN